LERALRKSRASFPPPNSEFGCGAEHTTVFVQLFTARFAPEVPYAGRFLRGLCVGIDFLGHFIVFVPVQLLIDWMSGVSYAGFASISWANMQV